MEASRPNLSHGWCIDGCCLPQPSDYFWGAQPTGNSRFAGVELQQGASAHKDTSKHQSLKSLGSFTSRALFFDEILD
jgi:hypothetical protein